MRSILILPGAALLTAMGAIEAQTRRLSLDLGTSSVRYADSIDVTALTLSPALELSGRRGSLGGMGTLSQASGASTYSGTVFGSVGFAPERRFSAEVGGSTGGSAHSDGTGTGQYMGNARLNLNAARGGAWVGAGAGQTSDGATWRNLIQGSIGAWVAGSAGSGVANILPTSVSDSITYTDAVVSVQRSLARVDLSASLGMRFGDPIPSLVTDRAWGGISATAWLTPRIGIVGSAGTYPIDFTQGFPGGRYLSLALRLQREAAAPRAEAPRPSPTLAFEARQRGGSYELRVRAPGATRVEIAGDFTGWQPVALTSLGDGWWSTSRAIGRGTHEMAVRIDGGAWEPPPGLVVVRDEFGGSSGVLVVP